MSESCPTSPYDKRNYRNDPIHRTGLKCQPRTFAVNKGIYVNGELVETGDTAEQAGDAVSSPVAGGAGCASCG